MVILVTVAWAVTNDLPLGRSMPITPEHIQAEILRLRETAGPDYGDNVIPAIRLFSSLESADERRAYQDALELMLRSDDSNIREYAITLCLGFFCV